MRVSASAARFNLICANDLQHVTIVRIVFCTVIAVSVVHALNAFGRVRTNEARGRGPRARESASGYTHRVRIHGRVHRVALYAQRFFNWLQYFEASGQVSRPDAMSAPSPPAPSIVARVKAFVREHAVVRYWRSVVSLESTRVKFRFFGLAAEPRGAVSQAAAGVKTQCRGAPGGWAKTPPAVKGGGDVAEGARRSFAGLRAALRRRFRETGGEFPSPRRIARRCMGGF